MTKERKKNKHNKVYKIFSKYKIPLCLFGTLLFSIYFYYSLFQYLFVKNHFDPFDGTEGSTCPACFGNKACPEFYRGEVNIKGIYRIPIFHKFKTRQIYDSYFGLFRKKIDVILKKLVTRSESETIDYNICVNTNYINLDNKCNPKDALWDLISQHPSNALQISHVERTKATSPMMHCVSERLFDRVKVRFKERSSKNIEMSLLRRDEIVLLYLLNVNQHSLMMQVFPSEDKWPFPKYYGACGRWIVEEHAGKPLNYFCNAYLWKKVQILINLLKLPDKLDRSNDKSEQYILYIGDADAENFMVNPESLDIKIVDLEHTVVVDVKHLLSLQMDDTDKLYVSPAQLCGHPLSSNYFNCSQQDSVKIRKELCRHTKSDHNQLSICAMLLSDESLSHCLLGDNKLASVVSLIRDCVHMPNERLRIVRSILEQLQHILDKLKKQDL